jgi:hypothetical protein
MKAVNARSLKVKALDLKSKSVRDQVGILDVIMKKLAVKRQMIV